MDSRQRYKSVELFDEKFMVMFMCLLEYTSYSMSLHRELLRHCDHHNVNRRQPRPNTSTHRSAPPPITKAFFWVLNNMPYCRPCFQNQAQVSSKSLKLINFEALLFLKRGLQYADAKEKGRHRHPAPRWVSLRQHLPTYLYLCTSFWLGAQHAS